MLRRMDGFNYIKQRQILWAQRRGIELIGSAGDRGVRAYTTDLHLNLFQPLSDRARACYEQGDGNELGNGDRPGKLQAVHSSAAIATNFFDYWMSASDPSPVLKALKVSSANSPEIEFEAKFRISPNHTRSPNLDVAIRYKDRAKQQVVAVECKFTEAYGGRGHGGLKPTYLEDTSLWGRLPALRRFAESISPEDASSQHLHPAQLVKHVLGLTASVGEGRFRLIYLWYDVPGPDGARHRAELNAFTRVALQDGVDFEALTYQELALRLAKTERSSHGVYVDYLCERYL